MNTESIKTELALAIESNASLKELREVLLKFKHHHGSPETAVSILEDLRAESKKRERPDLEDRVLELMDIVTGWCPPHLRIWD